jgi:hypothetical protein
MNTPIIGPIDAAELKPAYFLFAGELPTGATISTALVDVAVVTGTDANPAGILSGAVSIDNGTKIVSQKIAANGRAGNTYKLRCTATDSAGNVHVVAAQLAVVTL